MLSLRGSPAAALEDGSWKSRSSVGRMPSRGGSSILGRRASAPSIMGPAAAAVAEEEKRRRESGEEVGSSGGAVRGSFRDPSRNNRRASKEINPLEALRRSRVSQEEMSGSTIKSDLAKQQQGSKDDHDLMLHYSRGSEFQSVTSVLSAALGIGEDDGRRNSIHNRRGSGSMSARGRRVSNSISDDTGAGGERLHAWINPNHATTSNQTTNGSAKVHRIGVTAESEFELRSTISRLKGAKSDVSQDEAEWLIKVLRTHFLFSSMPTEQLLRIIKLMERVKSRVGDNLVSQGEDDAKDFYIVAGGTYEVIVNKTTDASGKGEPVVVARLGASACLGEMALLYNSKRTATVTASEESTAFKLTRAAYQVTLIDTDVAMDDGSDEEDGADAADKKKETSIRLPMLRKFPWMHDQIRPMHHGRVVSSLSATLPVSAGDPLLRSGQVGGVLVMILKGEVQFTGDAHKANRDEGAWKASSLGELCASGTLRAGDTLALGRPGDEALLATMHAAMSVEGSAGAASGSSGQLRLMGGTHHRCAAVALTDAEIMLISMAEFVALAADAPAVLSNRSGIRALLQNTPWCHDVSRQELDALAFAFKPLETIEGDVLIEQDSEAQALHLVVAGEIKVTKVRPDGQEVLVFKAGPGDVLGERSIAGGIPSMANVTVESPSVTLCLTRDAYASSLPSRMQPRIEKKRYASQISSKGFESLNELQVIAVVGQGAFARVALAKHKPTNVVYALKKIERGKVGEGHVRKQIMNERFVMGDVDHPFIAKLHATFKTAWSLFMVVEPCLGGELFSYMQRLDILPEKDARFYAACVASALEHLHVRNVVYRDLKPENVMISSAGYVKIIDFGFAKRLNLRTFTLCGTPEYLAPEMVMVRGHGKGVDWWALGVLLYEMVMGGAPHIIDPISKRPQYDLPPNLLYKSILNKKFEFYFPERLSSKLCDVVRGLLKWDALNRLGCLTDGAGDVKRHPFFADEDWDQLLAQTRPPPFIPQLKSTTDTSNFEEAVPDRSFVDEPAYDYSTNEWDRDF